MQISSRNLDRVRKLKSQMTRLTARVQKVSFFLYAGRIYCHFVISKKPVHWVIICPITSFHGYSNSGNKILITENVYDAFLWSALLGGNNHYNCHGWICYCWSPCSPGALHFVSSFERVNINTLQIEMGILHFSPNWSLFIRYMLKTVFDFFL